MVFVTANSSKTQLDRLTQLLVSAFPGSTIYQHTDFQHVPHDVLNNKVDAVFLDVEADKDCSLSLTKMLRRQKPGLLVFLLSGGGDFREEAEAAGASGYFVLSDSEAYFSEAIKLVMNKEKAS